MKMDKQDYEKLIETILPSEEMQEFLKTVKLTPMQFGELVCDTINATKKEPLTTDELMAILEGRWIGNVYIAKHDEDGKPVLPKVFWEDWD